MNASLRAVACLAVAALAGHAQEKLRLRYFYDKNDERLMIGDLRFLTPQRAIAIATLEDRGGRYRGTIVSSNDSGATWTPEAFKEIPRSMFFLDDSFGWIATEQGVWKTDEGGRSWRKISSQKGLLRIWFLDSLRGFAAGFPKLFLRTADGGKTWTKVAEADKPETKLENSVYSVISFASPKVGFVGGYSIPPRPGFSRTPDWMDPEQARRRRQRPTVLITLETRDGGQTWGSSSGSLFGRIAEMRLLPSGPSLALFQFDDVFEWPSEVLRINTPGANAERIFREKDRLVTDVLLQNDGTAYLIAIEPASPLLSMPIPGPVHLLRGHGPDYRLWQRIPVDYRAVGRRPRLAATPGGEIWAVTDDGMILSLSR